MMVDFPEKARPIVIAMNERIRPLVCDAMDECLAANLTQGESVDAILAGLFYQAGIFVAAFEKAGGQTTRAPRLSQAARWAVKHGRRAIKGAA